MVTDFKIEVEVKKVKIDGDTYLKNFYKLYNSKTGELIDQGHNLDKDILPHIDKSNGKSKK